MREIRQSGSEGGGTEPNRFSLPLSIMSSLRDAKTVPDIIATRYERSSSGWCVLPVSFSYFLSPDF